LISLTASGSENDFAMSQDRSIASTLIRTAPSLSANRSPISAEAGFKNWYIRTLLFWPAARSACPNAAVVLPLPLPV
jgi:hypothetical protein